MVRHPTVLNFNINGAASNKLELEALIAQQKPTIIVLSDTRLTKKARFHIPGYNIVRDDPTKGTAGGVAVLIKYGTPFRVIDPPILPNPLIHIVTIMVKLDQRNYTLSGLYRRPRSDDLVFKTLLNEAQKDRRHIIVGDLNARHLMWNNIQSNKAGNAIAKSSFTVIHPYTYTFRSHSNPNKTSTIDLLLTRIPHVVTRCSALDFVTTDHRPVLYELLGRVPVPEKTNYSFHEADWKQYKSLMYENCPEFTTISDTPTLDERIKEFTSLIINSADKTIPKFAPTPPSLRPPPPHITNLIALRNNLKNSWYRSRNPALRKPLNSLTTQIRSLMAQWKTSLWHDTLNKTHGDHRKFWKLVKTRITKRRSVLLHSGNLLMDSREQAETLATHLSADSQSRLRATVPEAPRIAHEGNFMFVSPGELNAILRRTKGGKSPGLDRVQYVLLRQLPRKAMSYFAHLLNSCIRLRHFPSSWKHAVVTPLLKPAKSGTTPDHYRPISLLSHMSKILEKVILKYLSDFCEERDLIPPVQAGFRPGHSVQHPVSRLQSHASAHLRKNQTTALISIDCTKAFDSVNHDILLKRLSVLECPEQLYNLIHSYLKHRTFQIRVGSDLSKEHPIPCGVPQGSVLAPTLFTIYTSHIISRTYPEVHISAYADDIAIYSTSANPTTALQAAESACQDISDRLRDINISVNPSKTDALLITFSSTKRCKRPKKFRIDGTYNPLSRSINYLGVQFDRHLRFSTHVRQKLKTVRGRFHSLYHLLTSPNLSLRLKLLIYKGVLRPTFLFSAPTLRYLTKTSLRQLQAFQNRVLRSMVWHTPFRKDKLTPLHEKLDLPKVSEFIKRRHVKFFDSLQYLPNRQFSTVTPPIKPRRWQGTRFSERLIDVMKL